MNRPSIADKFMRRMTSLRTSSLSYDNYSHEASPADDDNGWGSRSNIEHLPTSNKPKTDLSKNLGFIVVFQAIEIERLSFQVRILRNNLLDKTQQLFILGNYEVQIKELTDRCWATEKEREEILYEHHRLNLLVDRTQHDNEKLTHQVRQLKRLIEELKGSGQGMRDRIRHIEQEYENYKDNSLRAEERSKILIHETKERSNVFQEEIVRLNRVLEEKKTKLQQISQQLAASEAEIKHQRELLRDTERTYDQLKHSYDQIRRQAHQKALQSENHERQLKDLHMQFINAQNQLKQSAQYSLGFEEREQQLRNEIELLKEMVDRLRESTEGLSQELQVAREQKTHKEQDNVELQTDLKDKIAKSVTWKDNCIELQKKMMEMEEEIADLREEEEGIEDYVRSLCTKIDQLTQKNKDLETKCEGLLEELAATDKKYNSLSNESGTDKNHNSLSNESKTSFMSSKGFVDRKEFQAKVSELEQIISELAGQQERLQARIRSQLSFEHKSTAYLVDYEPKLSQYENELEAAEERQNDLLDKLAQLSKAESELRQINSQLSKQINLNSIHQMEYQSKISDLQTKIVRLTDELVSLKKLNEEQKRSFQANKSQQQNNYEQKLAKSKQQYDKLHHQFRIVESNCKIAQSNCKAVENKCKTAQNNFRTAQNNFRTAQNNFRTAQNSYKTAQNKFKIAEAECLKLKATIKQLQLSINQMKNNLNSVNSESNENKKRISQLSIQTQKAQKQRRESQTNINQQFNTIKKMESQFLNSEQKVKNGEKLIADIQKQKISVEKELQTTISQRDQLIDEIEQLTNEREQMVKDLTSFAGERDQLREKERKLTGQLQKLSVKNQKISQQKQSAQNEIQQISSQNKQLKSQIRSIQDSLKAAKTQISQLVKSNQEIQIERQHLSKQLAKTQQALKQSEGRNETLMTQNSSQQAEIQQLFSELQDVAARFETLTGKHLEILEQLNSNIKELEETKNQLELTSEQLRQEKQLTQQLQGELKTIQGSLAKISQDLDQMVEYTNERSQQVAHLMAQYETLLIETEKEHHLLIQTLGQVARMTEQLNRMVKIVEQRNQQIDELFKKNIDLQQSLADKVFAIGELEDTVKMNENKINALNVQIGIRLDELKQERAERAKYEAETIEIIKNLEVQLREAETQISHILENGYYTEQFIDAYKAINEQIVEQKDSIQALSLRLDTVIQKKLDSAIIQRIFDNLKSHCEQQNSAIQTLVGQNQDALKKIMQLTEVTFKLEDEKFDLESQLRTAKFQLDLCKSSMQTSQQQKTLNNISVTYAGSKPSGNRSAYQTQDSTTMLDNSQTSQNSFKSILNPLVSKRYSAQVSIRKTTMNDDSKSQHSRSTTKQKVAFEKNSYQTPSLAKADAIKEPIVQQQRLSIIDPARHTSVSDRSLSPVERLQRIRQRVAESKEKSQRLTKPVETLYVSMQKSYERQVAQQTKSPRKYNGSKESVYSGTQQGQNSRSLKVNHRPIDSYVVTKGLTPTLNETESDGIYRQKSRKAQFSILPSSYTNQKSSHSSGYDTNLVATFGISNQRDGSIFDSTGRKNSSQISAYEAASSSSLISPTTTKILHHQERNSGSSTTSQLMLTSQEKYRNEQMTNDSINKTAKDSINKTMNNSINKTTNNSSNKNTNNSSNKNTTDSTIIPKSTPITRFSRADGPRISQTYKV